MADNGNLLSIGTKILDGVVDHEHLINTIAGLAGVGPEVALAEKALPMVAATLKFLQQETGKGPLAAFKDFMDHLTPGMPNAPALAPTRGQ